jgi:hypothetical protein
MQAKFSFIFLMWVSNNNVRTMNLMIPFILSFFVTVGSKSHGNYIRMELNDSQ